MRVLLVEESPAAAAALVSIFRERSSWEIDVARDGCVALEVFDAGKYAVVVLDWHRSSSAPSGPSLCRGLRKCSSAVGLVVASTRAATPDKLEAFDAGADHYIVKPCDPLELVAHIAALGRRVTATPPLGGAGETLPLGRAAPGRSRTSNRSNRHLDLELSSRHLEILGRLSSGLGNKEIATELQCSVKNVEYHIGNLLRKTGCSTRSELVSWTWERKP